MRAMMYDCEHLVDMYDQVEILTDDGIFAGVVSDRHPKTSEVSVQYNTGEKYRTTGNPVFKTARIPLESIELIARDG